MVLIGNPQPTVKWFVDGNEDASESGSALIDATAHKYNYHKYFSSLSPALCKKKIKYTATGAVNSLSKEITLTVNCK